MKFEYTVKLNGRKYYPGEDVPIEEQKPNVVEPKEPEIMEKPVEVEAKVEKPAEKKTTTKAKSTKGK
ncbi:MAG: hypothetical protein IK068_03870 [Lachnospiraceae bacterium]|nr:hypothetical protein [Lachnospiraceae bacterium]